MPDPATDPGASLVAALGARDFPRLADTLSADVSMRALTPPGLVEISGAEATAAKLSTWFGDAEDFEIVRSGSETVADRVHIFYRLRVKKPGDVPKLVEQHLLCGIDGDRIHTLDLVCSGFRPADADPPFQVPFTAPNSRRRTP